MRWLFLFLWPWSNALAMTPELEACVRALYATRIEALSPEAAKRGVRLEETLPFSVSLRGFTDTQLNCPAMRGRIEKQLGAAVEFLGDLYRDLQFDEHALPVRE